MTRTVERSAALAEPFSRFLELLEQATALPRDRLPEPTAFALATSADNRPSVRMLLLKDADERGFVFYTNYESRKGRELVANPRVALCFHWAPLEIQVRVEGRAAPVTAQEADAYFASRPRGSQIGAWASQQSAALESAQALDARVADYERRFADRSVTRPPHWSGFRVT
ncbi:MAG: pyridoxamine 5'-phosphate oxidase, partial [Gemmatimonadetes bacterium]